MDMEDVDKERKRKVEVKEIDEMWWSMEVEEIDFS